MSFVSTQACVTGQALLGMFISNYTHWSTAAATKPDDAPQSHCGALGLLAINLCSLPVSAPKPPQQLCSWRPLFEGSQQPSILKCHGSLRLPFFLSF
jgi:hypothetical protein